MKSAIKKVFWFYTILFLILIGYLVKLCLFDSNGFVANSFNPRLTQGLPDVKRGAILDINGKAIAQDEANPDGSYTRKYDETGNYAHVVGYTVKGKAGIESKYNFRLQTVSNELLQRIGHVFLGKEIQGNNVVLTIDDRLQQVAAEALGHEKGSIVAIEPSTGKILAMVSYPTFDSYTVSENWAELNSDDENSPLLNRATQGLYPPGSTFKIITAASALEVSTKYTDFNFKCTGDAKFGDSILHCYDGKAHGKVDMTSAFAKSCNGYFATVAEEIGNDQLIKTATDFGFNTDLNFPLEYKKASFALKSNSDVKELAATAIGQGKTLTSPLFMAMVTSAIANNGSIMQPYIVDHIETPSGGVRNRTLPTKLLQACDSSTAHKIADMMCEVVRSGTATNASFSVSGKAQVVDKDKVVSDSAITSGAIDIKQGKYSGKITVAAKTGTAENASGDDHAWFVAFAPAEDPQIAVAVILENAGHGSHAIPDAKKVMKTYIENLEK